MSSPSRIIFTGITGLLGSYFLKNHNGKVEILGIGNKNIPKSRKSFFKVDITKKGETLDFIKDKKPQVIIHAASIGNVDYCEKNPDEAYKVNVEGTKNIIRSAKKINAKVIFLSSNAIYDGTGAPYDEEDVKNPVDIYGKTKLEGEKLVEKSGLKFVILRLITMYGWPQKEGRSNPVDWMIKSLKKGERINVVDDIYNNHLFAAQAADALWKILEKNIENEVYNIAGADSISRYDLALKVAKIFKLDPSLITPVNSDFFKSIARRPKNTSFDTKKMEKHLGIKPLSVNQGLEFMRDEVINK